VCDLLVRAALVHQHGDAALARGQRNRAPVLSTARRPKGRLRRRQPGVTHGRRHGTRPRDGADTLPGGVRGTQGRDRVVAHLSARGERLGDQHRRALGLGQFLSPARRGGVAGRVRLCKPGKDSIHRRGRILLGEGGGREGGHVRLATRERGLRHPVQHERQRGPVHAALTDVADVGQPAQRIGGAPLVHVQARPRPRADLRWPGSVDHVGKLADLAGDTEAAQQLHAQRGDGPGQDSRKRGHLVGLDVRGDGERFRPVPPEPVAHDLGEPPERLGQQRSRVIAGLLGRGEVRARLA
jgi:hypothetical protein